MLYRGPFSTSFYRMLHRVLHREFRARKAWDDLRPALRKPAKLRLRHLRRLATIAYSRVSLPLLRLELERRARAPHEGMTTLLPVAPEP